MCEYRYVTFFVGIRSKSLASHLMAESIKIDKIGWAGKLHMEIHHSKFHSKSQFSKLC